MTRHDRDVEHDSTTREEAIREDERRRVYDEERREDRVRDDDEHPDRYRRDDDRYDRRDDHAHYGPGYVRGGVSIGSILTGVAVALGALFLLTALVGGIAVAVGVADEVDATAAQIGWGVGIALVLSQFLAYLWGGYTAGRMARGAGILNGLLVPIAALLLVGLVVGIVAAIGADTRFAVPFTDVRVPVEQDLVFTYGIGFGIATLVAMFLGGILGGFLGARWHDKLEAVATEERAHAA